ncbi:MAG: hypothetical protein IPP35_01710 [Elusimicrobia bacterium]|nr:hypothetical protein [Elusimicrobiota bacterium]
MDNVVATINKKDSFHRKDLVSLVGIFATPLAILMGMTGILVNRLRGGKLYLCLGLLTLGALFNFVFPRLIARQSSLKIRGIVVQLRIITNVIFNSVLVYYLGEAFRPMWLVLALTPFATAIYASRARTLSASLTVSAALLTVFVLRGPVDAVGLAEQLTYCVFMLLISLMINKVAVYPPSSEEILTFLKHPAF